jgi:hypothetical protein
MLYRIGLDYLTADGARAAVGDTREVHLHLGGEGADGPVVAVLFDAESAGPPLTGQEQAGRITVRVNAFGVEIGEYHGYLTAMDLGGPLAGWTIDDVLDALRSGDPKLYVDVHAMDDPQGTRRGQLKHPQKDLAILSSAPTHNGTYRAG